MRKANSQIGRCLYGSGGQERSNSRKLQASYGHAADEAKPINTHLSHRIDPSTIILKFDTASLNVIWLSFDYGWL